MKKQIFLFCIIFSSCFKYDTPRGIIVHKNILPNSHNIMCHFRTDRQVYYDAGSKSLEYSRIRTSFIAPCDSFMVGDTLLLTKKNRYGL